MITNLKEAKIVASFKGLLYVKHGRVGTRSEGPDYYLQTYKEDFLLKYKRRHPWDPDHELEVYCRRMVEVTGEITGKRVIQVENIKEIIASHIPRP